MRRRESATSRWAGKARKDANMAIDSSRLPVGQKITLPGHFDQAVTLEGFRPLGRGFECRVRLPDGSLDETVISGDEARSLLGDNDNEATTIIPADADQVRLLIESTRIRLAYTPTPILRSASQGFAPCPTRSRRST